MSAAIQVAALYNTLPSVEEANAVQFDRTRVFAELAILLAAYEYKYGVCLVHAHCKLEEGEVMVASGNVSQPERNAECYPERWLPSGDAYEFTKEPTAAPPVELISQFRAIVDGIGILGLYAVAANEPAGVVKEWTEGRVNLTKVEADPDPDAIETAWLPGKDQPITMNCTKQCLFDARYGRHQKVHGRF